LSGFWIGWGNTAVALFEGICSSPATVVGHQRSGEFWEATGAWLRLSATLRTRVVGRACSSPFR